MKVRLTVDAEADFGDIGEYIAQDDFAMAHRFVAELKSFIVRVAEAPRSNRLRTEWSGRVRAARLGSYLVIFEVEGDEMLVLRIVNGRRDIAKLLESRLS